MCMPTMGPKPFQVTDKELASGLKVGGMGGGLPQTIVDKAKLPDYVKDGASSNGVTYYNTDGSVAYRNNAGSFIPRNGSFVSAVGPKMLDPSTYKGDYAAVEKAVAKEKSDWEKFMGIGQPAAKPATPAAAPIPKSDSVVEKQVQVAQAPSQIQEASSASGNDRRRSRRTGATTTSAGSLIDGGLNAGTKTLFGQ